MPIVPLDYKPAKIVMAIDTDVEAAYRAGACRKEPWTVAFIESLPAGSTFIDIGANVGSYSLIAAKLGLSVIAIEPGYASYAKLCQNLALNNLLESTIALCGAIGGTNAHLDWLNYSDMRAGAASHVLGGEFKVSLHRQRVMVYPLDFLLEVDADAAGRYLKIDVDGNELAVLAGGGQLLQHPATRGILIEAHKSETAGQVDATLRDHGFLPTGVFDEREGKSIGDVVYLQYARG